MKSNIKKAVQAYVLTQDIDDLKAGTVIHVDADKGQALVDAGLAEEASEEDLQGEGEEEGDDDDQAAPMQEAAVARAVNRIARNLEDQTAKAVEAALAKHKTNNIISIPAQTKEPVFKGFGELFLHAWRAQMYNDVKSKNMLRS